MVFSYGMGGGGPVLVNSVHLDLIWQRCGQCYDVFLSGF